MPCTCFSAPLLGLLLRAPLLILPRILELHAALSTAPSQKLLARGLMGVRDYRCTSFLDICRWLLVDGGIPTLLLLRSVFVCLMRRQELRCRVLDAQPFLPLRIWLWCWLPMRVVGVVLG